jgi:hypothetical protein
MTEERNPTDDRLIGETEKQAGQAGTRRAMQAANLFDLRRIIGGLFVVYGVILLVAGITDSDAEIDKAAGVNINLWTGLGMLAVGALFLLWAFTRPLGEQLEEAESEPAPPASDEAGGRSWDDREGSRRVGDSRTH